MSGAMSKTDAFVIRMTTIVAVVGTMSQHPSVMNSFRQFFSFLFLFIFFFFFVHLLTLALSVNRPIGSATFQ